MSEGPKRRGLLGWISRVGRVISLPLGITQYDDADLRKIVDWLPIWALFIAIPLGVAGALAVGFFVVRFF